MATAAFADAYKQTLRETDDPRTIERRVFAQITAELEEADSKGRDAQSIAKLTDALGRNQTLWSFILCDLVSLDNTLPNDIRARMISFALYVERMTPQVLAGKAPLRPLIDLNRRIMLGLSGVKPDDEPSADAAAASTATSGKDTTHGTEAAPEAV